MKTKVINKIILLAVLTIAMNTAGKESVSVARLRRHLEKETSLRQRLENQLKLLASTEEHRQQRMAEMRQIQAARSSMEDEVLLLEAEASKQQTRLREAQAEAAEVARTLKNNLANAQRLKMKAERGADEASRRVCEALTVDRGQLNLLCRGITRQPAPEIAKVLQWLAKQSISKAGDGTQSVLTRVLQLLLVWITCIAVVWVLLSPACKLRRRRRRSNSLKKE